MSKYKNCKICVDGEKFDSKKEYARWLELRAMQEAGKITSLRRQVKYRLIPATRKSDGKLEHECSYVADFLYLNSDGKAVVEDVKGYRDPKSAGYAKFAIKRKLMLQVYGIEVREV